VIKVVRVLQKRFEIVKGVRIHLVKKIPAEAGLAGGSSDAAATLKGLNRLWRLNLTKTQLLGIGVGIGADVPYCLIGGTALVEGIGEKITPLKPLKKLYVLVVKPEISIATPWAFKKLDEGIIETHPDIPAIIKRLEKERYEELGEIIGNVFEPVVFKCYPEIETIKRSLTTYGALAAIMTGSGSTVVGYFIQRETAEKARLILGQKYKSCFLSATTESEGGRDDVE
jgi:4-diphosphocytidyl-2-C-methyl-D-erythritol kinase